MMKKIFVILGDYYHKKELISQSLDSLLTKFVSVS